MTLEQFLQWLIASGGSIATVSFILERLEWFQAKLPKTRDMIIFGAATGVSLSALAVVKFVPEATIEAITPFFLVIAANFATVFLGKAFHKVDKPSAPEVTVVQAPGGSANITTTGSVSIEAPPAQEKQ